MTATDIREQYTNPIAAALYLQDMTILDKWEVAHYMLGVAKDPKGRWQLTTSECAKVQTYLEKEIQALRAVLHPVFHEWSDLRDNMGASLDEIQERLEEAYPGIGAQEVTERAIEYYYGR